MCIWSLNLRRSRSRRLSNCSENKNFQMNRKKKTKKNRSWVLMSVRLFACSVVDYALLLYNSWTYSDKPILKHPFYVFSIRSREQVIHMNQKDARVCPLSALNFITFFVGKMPWYLSLGMEFFNKFFFFRSFIVRRGEIFFLQHFFLLFPLISFFPPFFSNCWFLQVSRKHIFISYPSVIRCEPETEPWTLANENSLLSPTSSLVWMELCFLLFFDNACA